MESWGEVKSLPSVRERKKNWGMGRGRGKKNYFIFIGLRFTSGKAIKRFYFSFPAPHPLRHSVILAPILPVCSESKIAAKHSIDHQNRLHWRLRAKLDENCELRGTDNVQGQISEHIFAAKLRLLCLLSIGFKNWGIFSK